MDDSTEGNGGRTSVLPPATPPGRRPGAGEGAVETVLPPPAGRAAFRDRFLEVAESPASEARVEARPVPEAGGPRPMDPDLGHLVGLLTDLADHLQEEGEAALDLRGGLPSFHVTLRAYCRGYLDGRRGGREE